MWDTHTWVIEVDATLVLRMPIITYCWWKLLAVWKQFFYVNVDLTKDQIKVLAGLWQPLILYSIRAQIVQRWK